MDKSPTARVADALRSILDIGKRNTENPKYDPFYTEAEEALKGFKEPELSHVIVRTTSFGGYWGKGKTIDEALKNAQFIDCGEEVYVIRCDSTAYIDEYDGHLSYNFRHRLGVGKVRRRNGVWLVVGEFESTKE